MTVNSKSLVSKFKIEESSVAELNTQSKTLLHDLPKTDDCPCSDPNWCKPIEDVPDKEVFAFSIRNDASHWQLFDWSKLTTVVMFGYINSKLTCLAHSHNVKVVILGDVTVDIFTDATKRQQWIEKQLLLVKQNFLDGINFDFEGQVGLNDTLVRDSYTALVKETALAFKKELPYSQISVDVGWKPNVDIRFFDYQGLADAADLLFVMAYDEQSQIFGECIAGPNSAYKSANIGLDNYLNGFENKIPANKLILGVPWYGYIYKCIQLIEDKCYIEEVPFRGVNCSDAAGRQYDYGPIYNLIQTMPEKYQWNSSSLTPFITYANAEIKQSYQVQFDDPKSLKLKYDLAAQKGLKGVGMWNIDALDYSDTQVGEYIRSEMFGALPSRSSKPREENTKKPKEDFGCPCENPLWCQPFKTTHKNEVYMFSLENDENHWQKYDWSKITSVIMHNYINASLVCLAHSHYVKVFINGNLDKSIKHDTEGRKKWIAEQISLLRNNFLDGINFDFTTEHMKLQDEFTDFIQQAFILIKKELPCVQVHFHRL
ncbi:hypothetical protein Btru_043520 [Bulinus truncatus]|nr:hypothetical protein Btru_043520 [Bulinus truncatus]